MVVCVQIAVAHLLLACNDTGDMHYTEQKENTDWVKKCMEYEVEGSRPRGRPKRTWSEVVQKRLPNT